MRFRILLLLAGLIAYGSLYPFNFILPQSHASEWAKLFLDWSLVTGKGDALGNVGLFIPFGFFGVLSLPAQSRPPPRIAVIVLASLALATVLQIAQIYFPPRTPAMIDVIWNMAGAATGIIAGVSLSKHFRLHWPTWDRAYSIPLALIALWVAAELLPLVPALDLQEIKESAKALMRFHMSPVNVLWHAVGALLAGCALTAIASRDRALRWLGLLVVVVIAGKIFVVTRVLNASTLVGLAVGYGVWHLVSGWQRPGRAETVVLAALLAAYTLKALEPFQLQVDPREFSWIPFASMLRGSMRINAQSLIESVFFFAGMLGLIRMQGANVGVSSIMLALWVGTLEAIQMYIVGRSPDITEPLLVLLVGQILRHMPSGNAPPATPDTGPRRSRKSRTS